MQAGTKSWKAFFFGSFDSSNFITVDKSPAALWVMELSARMFGVNSWSILVPNALEGWRPSACCTPRCAAGSRPGPPCWPGAVVALTPVAALMFRFNNPDAFLVLLLDAGRLRHRAGGRGRPDPLVVLAGALVGFGFLAKMLQAFLVVPAFALVVSSWPRPGPLLAAAPAARLRRAWPWWRRRAGGCWRCSSRPPRTGPTSAARRTTASGI